MPRSAPIVAFILLFIASGANGQDHAEAISAQAISAQAVRQHINLNRDWRFTLGDVPAAASTDFDDRNWSRIGLPHSFSIPYFQWKDFYVGYGWYRKHLQIDPGWLSRRVCIEFQGAFQDAEVFVNGRRIGEHKGGFTGFSMDITGAIHANDNVLAVRLNNNWNPRIEPRSGDHTFMGGIYRNVFLTVTDPLHITWYGTFVTTPKVSAQSAAVDVKTEVINEGAGNATCDLTTELVDPDGKTVSSVTSTQTFKPGETRQFDQNCPLISSPRLWHPAHPNMYTAVSTASVGGRVVDRYETPFGIRSIQWTADRGFFINGEHFYFHGANVHQDHAGWGDAVTDAGAFRDVKLVKDAGLDFIRGSHYPHHPAFADACDRLGVLFWSENCFWGMGHGPEGYWTAAGYPPDLNDQPAFEQNALDALREEIRIFRNHPSIVAWSMCNEVFFSANPDKVKALLKRLVDEAHRLDPTRPAAIGGCQRGGLDKLGDIAGYNGDGARLRQFQNPGIPNLVSEYGSHISDRGDPNSDRYDGMFNQSELNLNTPEYPWRSGQSLWCAFDYGTILGHFGCMGFVDYFRIPKRSWYWYRDHFLHIPPPAWRQPGVAAGLALTADKTTILGTDATDDRQILVTVCDKAGLPISNSPPVKLTIESGPGEFPTGRSITFSPPSQDPRSDIAIRDGLAAIEFRSYFGGKTVLRASSPGLKDGTLVITTVGQPVFVPGVSPLAPDRPYFRIIRGAKNDSEVHNIAVDHPVSASSEAAGHPARCANDGAAGAGWQAADAKPGAWWQIDMEGLVAVKAVSVQFAQAAGYQYKVEGSTDGATWILLADESRSTDSSSLRTSSCRPNDHLRFLKLTITRLPGPKAACVKEICIYAN